MNQMMNLNGQQDLTMSERKDEIKSMTNDNQWIEVVQTPTFSTSEKIVNQLQEQVDHLVAGIASSRKHAKRKESNLKEILKALLAAKKTLEEEKL